MGASYIVWPKILLGKTSWSICPNDEYCLSKTCIDAYADTPLLSDQITSEITYIHSTSSLSMDWTKFRLQYDVDPIGISEPWFNVIWLFSLGVVKNTIFISSSACLCSRVNTAYHIHYYCTCYKYPNSCLDRNRLPVRCALWD